MFLYYFPISSKSYIPISYYQAKITFTTTGNNLKLKNLNGDNQLQVGSKAYNHFQK